MNRFQEVNQVINKRIADGDIGPPGGGGVDTANGPLAGEFARFTDSNTIEGRTGPEVRSDLGVATLASPTFTGTVTIPTPFTLGATSVTPTGTELNFVDGVTSAIQTQLDSKLASSAYTAADVLAKLLTVDGAGSGIDADLLDGSSSAAFATAAHTHEFVTAGADVAVNNVADQTIATRTVTGLAAGDQILVDGFFVILNNSGATRVYVLTLDFDNLFDIEFSTGALAASATLMHPFWIRGVLDIRSTSLAYSVVQVNGQLAAGIASGGDVTMQAANLQHMSWGTTASNATGSTDVVLKCRSANATATQTLRLHNFVVRKQTPN